MAKLIDGRWVTTREERRQRVRDAHESGIKLNAHGVPRSPAKVTKRGYRDGYHRSAIERAMVERRNV